MYGRGIDHRTATASIIIPAHNEERSIGRLLDALTADVDATEFEVLVVCNGCTDRTGDIARRYEPSVRVVTLPTPSKREALKHGDSMATAYPRLYIDSDVLIDAPGVRALVAALHAPVLVAAPVRILPRRGVSRLVRAYYDVWEQLPQVRSAPFGRGVVALSKTGHERIRELPPVMADDLAMTAAFGADERTTVREAAVTIWPPRTLRDLLRRRTRISSGNAQIDQDGGRPKELKTSPRILMQLACEQPRLIPKLPVFLGVALASRFAALRQAKRGDRDTWLRDESSRGATN